MSVMRELTIAVLLRFAITPKDPITAHVNQDMKETEITAHRQVRNITWPFCIPSKGLLFLFFHDKMLFIAIFLDSRPYYLKILNGKFIMFGMPCIFDVLSANIAGIRNFAFLFFLIYFFFLLSASLTV